MSFRSALDPPCVRKTCTLENAIAWLYLKGVSSGNMSEVLRALLESKSNESSPSIVSRLKQQWRARDMSRQRFVYL